jgi:hypothetical protein
MRPSSIIPGSPELDQTCLSRYRIPDLPRKRGTQFRDVDSIRLETGMTMTIERNRARTLRRWAISVLDEAGAIRECEAHCWI